MKQELVFKLRWLQMFSLDSVHCWGKINKIWIQIYLFFIIKFICLFVGGFAAEVM